MLRLSLFCLSLAALSAPALAGACDPVETAPGVKSLPQGCKPPHPVAAEGEDKTVTIDKRTGRRVHTTKIGDTEIRYGASVSVEAGTRR